MGEIIETLDYKKTAKPKSRYERIEIKKYFYIHKIKKIIQNKLAYKHNLKKGDIILFINNIPCINHKQSIETLENLSLSYKMVELVLL